jgi:hypothetical protein
MEPLTQVAVPPTGETLNQAHTVPVCYELQPIDEWTAAKNSSSN